MRTSALIDPFTARLRAAMVFIGRLGMWPLRFSTRPACAPVTWPLASAAVPLTIT